MSTKLFVGGLPWAMDTQRLKEVFAEFGDLVDARVITDRETGRSRGFGFVTYGSPEGADRAITLDGQEVDGRRIRVDRAQEKERPSGPPGPRPSGPPGHGGPPRSSRPDGEGGGPPRSFDGPPRGPSPSVAPGKPKASAGAAPGRDRGGGGRGEGGGGDDFGRKPDKAGRGRRKGGRGGRGGGGGEGGGDFDDYEY